MEKITGEQLLNELRNEYPSPESAQKGIEEYQSVIDRCNVDEKFHKFVQQEYEMPDIVSHMTLIVKALTMLY